MAMDATMRRLTVRLAIRRRVLFGPDDDKLGLTYAFQSAEFRSKALQGGCRAAKSDKFHAEIMVQMDVHGRNDVLSMGVLNVDHFVSKLGATMVVDQRQARGDFRSGTFPRSRRELFSKQLPYCFASRGKSALGAILVELFEQIRFEGHRKPSNFRHGEAPDSLDRSDHLIRRPASAIWAWRTSVRVTRQTIGKQPRYRVSRRVPRRWKWGFFPPNGRTRES